MRNFKQSTALIAGLMLLVICTGAQDELATSKQKTSYYNGFYLGAHASTNGWGFNAKYAINDWLAFKTGYESLRFSKNFDFEEFDIEYAATLDFKTGGILALADLSYTKNLYISAGAVFNSFNPKIEGNAISDYHYGDIVISAEDIGEFTFTVKPGLKVAPYGAAGFQAFMGKRDGVVFNLETGIYYMGSPDIEIEATGLLSPTADPAHKQSEYLESQFESYRIYPVIKFSLAVKLF
jgi:hypothetical protein